MRPIQRLAIDILLEQAFPHHQPEVAPRPAPRSVRRLVDDVTQIVQPPRIGRLVVSKPGFTRLAALPCPRREAEDLDFDTAALERPRQDVGAGCRDRDRPAPHRA